MKQLWERKMIYNHEVNITDGIKKNTLVNFNRHDKKSIDVHSTPGLFFAQKFTNVEI